MATTEADQKTDLKEWRERARTWLAENMPKRGERPPARNLEMGSEEERRAIEEAQGLRAKLYDAGYAGITWPAEYGGAGLTREHERAFREEAAGYDLPTQFFTIGIGMCGPTVLAHGTEEQKQRYIPKLLRGDEIWCQLFSEPGAGSDVASLQMRAERVDGEWILNGQKVWTTGAHYSKWGAVIARTDPDVPKHQGITMFVVDMKADGVDVRPLRQITGDANFNEVFFDDVRVPAPETLGDVNDGWRSAITMLMNERVAIGGGGGGARRGGGIEGLAKLAKSLGLWDDPVVRDRLMELYVRERGLREMNARISARIKRGDAPGPEGSLMKLAGTRLGKDAASLGMGIHGPSGIAWDPDDEKGDRSALRLLGAPAGSIAGGTDEVLLNIIGERVLGLPREPRVDKDVPFKELKVGTLGS